MDIHKEILSSRISCQLLVISLEQRATLIGQTAQHFELIMPFSQNKKATPPDPKVRLNPHNVRCIPASLRWYYPGQVVRVVRSFGLSAAGLP
jgi:hypothetical protein